MILVDVYFPSLDETYDFMLDENAEADQIILEICGMVAKKVQNGAMGDTRGFMLYHMTAKKALEGSRSLASSGVKDGSRLMLV